MSQSSNPRILNPGRPRDHNSNITFTVYGGTKSKRSLMTCQRSPGFSLVFVVTCYVRVSHSYFRGSADQTDKDELCVPAELGARSLAWLELLLQRVLWRGTGGTTVLRSLTWAVWVSSHHWRDGWMLMNCGTSYTLVRSLLVQLLNFSEAVCSSVRKFKLPSLLQKREIKCAQLAVLCLGPNRWEMSRYMMIILVSFPEASINHISY